MLRDFTKDKFDIIIQAGQSNSDGTGRGDTAKPYDPSENENVWHFNRNFTISQAMELRSFGKNKTRTWYNARDFAKADYIVIIASASLIVVAVILNISNGGRFFNPFI